MTSRSMHLRSRRTEGAKRSVGNAIDIAQAAESCLMQYGDGIGREEVTGTTDASETDTNVVSRIVGRKSPYCNAVA